MQRFIKENKRIIILILIGCLVMGIICLLMYDPLMKILNNGQIFRENIIDMGLFGFIIMSLLMSLQVIFVFLPGEIIEVLAGYIFGTFNGMLACILGSAIGTIIIFCLVRFFDKKFIHKFLKDEELYKISFLKHHPYLEYIFFIIFFVPGTPKDILTYFAPFTKIKLTNFLLITSFARIPSIITSTISGDNLAQGNYLISIVVFIITGLISLLGIYLYHRFVERKTI